MAGYPITLQLKGKRILIVGGGKVAARKVPALIAAGANLIILSPKLDEAFKGITLDWLRESYSQEALQMVKPFLVFAATDDSRLNQKIALDTRHYGCLVNVVTDARLSDFYSMATVERGSFTIGISSNASSPALLNIVKERIAAVLSDGLVSLGTWLGSLRSVAKMTIQTQEDRQALYEKIISSDVLPLLEAGKKEEAQSLFNAIVEEAL